MDGLPTWVRWIIVGAVGSVPFALRSLPGLPRAHPIASYRGASIGLGSVPKLAPDGFGQSQIERDVLTEVGGRRSEPSPNRQGPFSAVAAWSDFRHLAKAKGPPYIALPIQQLSISELLIWPDQLPFSQASLKSSRFPCQPVQAASAYIDKYLIQRV